MTLPLALTDLDGIPVDRLNGVGDQRRQALSEVNIHSVFDLITYYPR
ncbi:MAG: nitrogen-specific signal transduction histidine kinase, partial [Candidatus Poriferisodalaceae bacterium]